MTVEPLCPILFLCEDGNHTVSRGDAVRRQGELVCPRHYQEQTPDQRTLGDVQAAAGGPDR